ncbi:MAG TPA: DsbA family protein, partial [Candidatus Dormibacteraeota bacterium]|nr:DsbA family protein [Candidatus Dormibacteraeota bacterium]
KEAFALPGHSDLAEFARKEWPEFLLARGRTQEALEQAQVLVESPSRMTRFAGHTLIGNALVALNRAAEAEKELASAKDQLVLLPETDADRVRSYSETLRAEILLSQKKSAEGAALMRQIEEQLGAQAGPDARSQALMQLDSIARHARDTQEWALAELTARQMIQQEPSYAGGYYALGLAAEKEGDLALASQQFGVAERLWSEADKDLPELQDVRRKLALRQTELPENRQEYLNRLREHAEMRTPPQAAKADLSLDPTRLRGNPHAPVMIVEFSDFQCPFCRKVQPILKQLLAKYDGRVSLTYRDFPLRGMHGQAELGAESARCAGEQGKFWEYHDLLFENPDKFNRDGLIELARDLKLDEKQFDSCLSGGRYRSKVEEDLQRGIRAGVFGTPGIFINGILLSGAQPEAAFQRVIDSELATAKKQPGDP